MNIQRISEKDQDQYYKITKNGLNIFIHHDAFFMISGFPKVTIDLTNTPYGDYLIINELNPT
ncbi:MAG: hypothetical protein ACTSQI_17800 [Candidatus Helarchaeota archaeon]